MNDYAAHMIENCTISFCADISVAAHSKLGETAVSVGTLKLDVTVTCAVLHMLGWFSFRNRFADQVNLSTH